MDTLSSWGFDNSFFADSQASRNRRHPFVPAPISMFGFCESHACTLQLQWARFLALTDHDHIAGHLVADCCISTQASMYWLPVVESPLHQCNRITLEVLTRSATFMSSQSKSCPPKCESPPMFRTCQRHSWWEWEPTPTHRQAEWLDILRRLELSMMPISNKHFLAELGR